jgi:sortase A
MRIKKLAAPLLAALVLVAGVAACGSPPDRPVEQGSGNMSEEAGDEQVAPEKGSEQAGGNEAEMLEPASSETLRLTVPKMERIKDVEIPTGVGTDEAMLRENYAIRLQGTGLPWEEEANVYIAGHRLGYSGTESHLAFYDIDKLKNGDEVIVTDAEGREYTYEVFKNFVVEPTDLYVLEPIEGKNIVSLQACTLPDYSNRVIVQAELKDVKA